MRPRDLQKEDQLGIHKHSLSIFQQAPRALCALETCKKKISWALTSTAFRFSIRHLGRCAP